MNFCSSLRSQCWTRLFLWFSNTFFLQGIQEKSTFGYRWTAPTIHEWRNIFGLLCQPKPIHQRFRSLRPIAFLPTSRLHFVPNSRLETHDSGLAYQSSGRHSYPKRPNGLRYRRKVRTPANQPPAQIESLGGFSIKKKLRSQAYAKSQKW